MPRKTKQEILFAKKDELATQQASKILRFARRADLPMTVRFEILDQCYECSCGRGFISDEVWTFALHRVEPAAAEVRQWVCSGSGR
jgi:hypothetical protein